MTTHMASEMSSPACVLVFSGKRKSGKDYITDILLNRLGNDTCCILRLSGPLKYQYAKEHNLDYEKLLGASEYKEKYRADMIRWGEERRTKDPGFFARIICSGPGSEKPVWIISDARRKTDVAYFSENYPAAMVKVRVQATQETRAERGWAFTQGVDDAESECGLDDGVPYDIVINNDKDQAMMECGLGRVLQAVRDRTSGVPS